MALGLNKILLAGTNTNTAGAYFQTVNLANVGIGNATTGLAAVIPAGTYISPGGAYAANLVIEVNLNVGNAATWTQIIGNAGSGIIISDGQNVRANATTGTQLLTMITVNGGANIVGTFNAS
jgi:hypothetical protein